MRTVCNRAILALLIMIAGGSLSALNDAAPAQQIGIDGSSTADLADVRRYMLYDLSSRFRKAMAQEQKDFSSLRAPRAAALCMDWNSTVRDAEFLYFGYSFSDNDKDTRESINKLALDECNAAKVDPPAREWSRLGVHLDCDCELLFEDSRIVMGPPEHAVRKLAEKLSKVVTPTLCAQWFNNPYKTVSPNSRPGGDWLPCPGYIKEDALESNFVIDHLGSPDQSPSGNIFPGPPEVRPKQIEKQRITDPESGSLVGNLLSFSPPTGDDLYSANIRTPYTGKVFSYRLNRVPASAFPMVLAKLNSLVPSKLYGRFSRTKMIPVDLPGFNPTDSIARYIRIFDLSDEDVAKALDFAQLPEHGMGIVRGEHSKKMWVECFIPVDHNWVPVGAPLRFIVPIALETTTSLYLFDETARKRRADPGGRASASFAFDGRVFDLSGCDETAGCFEKVERSFAMQLTSAFEQPPLSASPVHTPMAPRQVRMQRLYEQSEVLKGFVGPFFELTTYTLSWWNAPSGDLYGTPEFYFTGRKASDSKAANQIFLNVDLALQIGVGRKSDYPEPTPEQFAAYRRAVEGAVSRAVIATAKELEGTVQDGVGVIKSPGGSIR